MEFSFNIYNTLAPNGEVIALKKMIADFSAPPVVVCIGSDLSVGDALGPVVGTKLKEKLMGKSVYVYGTLAQPITAHEVKYMNTFIRNTHPDSPVIAVDAAVGVAGDIGLIKICRGALRPGSGANKRLARVGDVSVLGIVAEKSLFNYSLFSSTRLNFVYKMAEVIAEGLATFLLGSLQSAEIALKTEGVLRAV